MSKLLVAGLTGALITAGVITLTAAHGGPFGHGHDPAALAAHLTDRVEGVLDDLDATPAQRTQVLAVKDRMLGEIQKHQATRQETHAALLAEWNSPTPDRAKLHALVDQRAAEMTATAHQAVDAAIEVHDALTPDQRAKLARKAERFGPR
jgi:periplasmic protein CpxP/Spy